MADTDFNDLRQWLDEEERFASSIKHGDPRMAIAQEMLAIIAEARRSLFPSTDGTANYVPQNRIVEDLAALRQKAEHFDER